MKITRQPTKSGPDWWVVTHDLNIGGAPFLDLRPIHVFTYLAQHLPGLGDKKKTIYYSCHALENKLFAVRYQSLELRKAIAEWNDLIYQDTYLKDYGDQQRVICVLEALLNSIYSSLEITALINKLIYPQLRQSFSEQAEKETFFSFKKWKWLCYFYDLRRELEHYGTTLPQMTASSILIEISRPKKNYILIKGRWEVAFASILSFATNLFDMLDQWASQELKKINPDTELIMLFRQRANEPLKPKKVKAKYVLNLIQIDNKTLKVPSPESKLTDPGGGND